MATELTLQDDMADFTYSAADATGNTYDNSTGMVYLHVKNEGGTMCIVTVTEQRTCSFGHQATNSANVVMGNTTKIFGPFDLMRFNDSSRKVNISYSQVADISVAAVKA